MTSITICAEEDKLQKPSSEENLKIPYLIRRARTPGEKRAVEMLIAGAQTAFDEFLTSSPSAAELYILRQALDHANSSGSLVETFLWNIDMELPKEEQTDDVA